MRGVVFLGDRTVELREFADPEPGPGEVLVAVRASGMCGSDLHLYRDVSGQRVTSGEFIAGHEPAGVIHSVGSGVPAEFAVGDHVMVHHYLGCGSCDACRSGWPQMCSGTTMRALGDAEHGGHADLLRVPARTLVPLNPKLSFAAGAAISCGTGTAWGALDRLGDVGGSTLAVFGQGPVGLSATLLGSARGARVIAVDPNAERRDRAERFGAVGTVDPRDSGAVDLIRELAGDGGPSLVLDTSGSSAAAVQAVDVAAPWARICFAGLGGAVRFQVTEVFHRQLTFMTSWTMSIVQLHQCADFVARNELDIDDLFTHRWTLDQAIEAYQILDQQQSGKGVFVVGDTD